MGLGTQAYHVYSRDHSVSGTTKDSIIEGSADPTFRGNAARYNPEELLVASLSTCHMLWYLHLCADHKVTVLEYTDNPVGIMLERQRGMGFFNKVVLRPEVLIADPSQEEQAKMLHKQASQYCFIANSVTFPVLHEPIIRVAPVANP